MWAETANTVNSPVGTPIVSATYSNSLLNPYKFDGAALFTSQDRNTVVRWSFPSRMRKFTSCRHGILSSYISKSGSYVIANARQEVGSAFNFLIIYAI